MTDANGQQLVIPANMPVAQVYWCWWSFIICMRIWVGTRYTSRLWEFFFFFKSRSEVHENTLGIVILLAGVSPEQQTAFYREKKKKRKEIEETQRRTICQKGRLNRDRWLLKVQEKESFPCPQVLKADRLVFWKSSFVRTPLTAPLKSAHCLLWLKKSDRVFITQRR